MEKYTLDTCVIIAGCIDNDSCSKIVNQFLDEIHTHKNFMTPQVKKEITELNAVIATIFYMIQETMKKENISFQEAYDKYGKMGTSILKDYLNKKLSNFVDFSVLKEKQGISIETLRKYINERMCRFLREDIIILPKTEDKYANQEYFKTILEFVKQEKLANGDGDCNLLSELILVNKISGDLIKFYTRNPRDFKNNDPKWVEKYSFIFVENLL